MTETARLAKKSKKARNAWKARLAETDRMAKIANWTEKKKGPKWPE